MNTFVKFFNGSNSERLEYKINSYARDNDLIILNTSSAIASTGRGEQMFVCVTFKKKQMVDC